MPVRSLAWKLSALIFVTYIGSFAVNSLVFELTRGRVVRESRRGWGLTQGVLTARLLEQSVPGPMPDAKLQDALRRAFDDLTSLTIVLFDSTGRVRASLHRLDAMDLSEPKLRAAAAKLATGRSYLLSTAAWEPAVGLCRVGHFSPPLYAAVANVPQGWRPIAWLLLHHALGLPVLFVIASNIAGLLALRLFLKRIRVFEEGVARLSKGDLSARIDPGPDDEMGRLGRAFNKMAENLETAMTELAAQDQARREILADVAHELRTPLTSMLCQVQLLQEQASDQGEEFRQQLEIISEDGLALGKRIRDLLTIAREEARSLVLNVKKWDLMEVLRHVCDRFRPLCRQHSVELETALESSPLLMDVDRDRLIQVFENLLQNALQSIGEHGRICISSALEPGQVAVHFRDTGPGIPAEELRTIFERFRRGKGSRGAGTGLGLAIVKKFVELHGGRCTATSELGRGSTFTVTLPA